jgi:hypothetical protein
VYIMCIFYVYEVIVSDGYAYGLAKIFVQIANRTLVVSHSLNTSTF